MDRSLGGAERNSGLLDRAEVLHFVDRGTGGNRALIVYGLIRHAGVPPSVRLTTAAQLLLDFLPSFPAIIPLMQPYFCSLECLQSWLAIFSVL